MPQEIIIIGGGLAGSEAAWQASQRGARVKVYEMRPLKMTPAHTGGDLAELVCSNSLGSDAPSRASGLLKEELRRLGSLLIEVADAHRVPAGSALAVDREGFAASVTQRITQATQIQVIRQELSNIPATGPVIVASGPLTSPTLAQALQDLTSQQALYFYDALAPIVEVTSIDFGKAFRASRYNKGETDSGDYINCPMYKTTYDHFIEALLNAERHELRAFERDDPHFFEGCLPVEILAERGHDALAYGPLRPVGLRDPRTGERPHAVVQLRQDNAAGTLYNLVGFQTNLKYDAQKRVFRLIPGLEKAHFVRYGSMHRNTYINAPTLLHPTLQFRNRADLFFAGQIAGIEGYVGNIAAGWLAGVNAVRLTQGRPLLMPPPETMIGALMHYITHADAQTFQPMKANFGLVPSLAKRVKGKRARREAYARRALEALDTWKASLTD
jgi:methylenetetrahydrofolate--tRNA-(uracil-5-)-methyltransferase